VTHQEKDFGDHLEESITKIDGAILRQQCLLTELIHSQKNIGTAHFITQSNLVEAHIVGLKEAKTILLGG
jgi:hypothetical protein